MSNILKINELQYLTKKDIATITNNFIEDLENSNPLELHTAIKAMEAIIKGVTSDKRYKDAVLEEAEKYGKSFDFLNSKIQIKEAGVKYDFTHCESPELTRLEVQKNEIDSKIKEVQNFLKSVPLTGVEVVDELTGEVVRVYPPSKTSETTVSLTIK